MIKGQKELERKFAALEQVCDPSKWSGLWDNRPNVYRPKPNCYVPSDMEN